MGDSALWVVRDRTLDFLCPRAFPSRGTERGWLALRDSGSPRGRDSTIFYNTLTLAQREALLESLVAARPDYVFLRGEGTDDYYTDTREYIRESLSRHYEHAGTAGIFDLWRSKTEKGEGP